MNRQEKLVLSLAVLASFVAFLDGSVVNVALPAISEEIGGGLVLQQWVVDSYLITLGALILVAGSISDVFGRKRVMFYGLIGFALTSIGIGFSPTPEMIVIMRGLQGIAGAMLVPSSLALITSTFRDEAQGRAIGIWTALTSIAMLIGPLVGGLFVDGGSWRGIFFINVLPVTIALLVLARIRHKDVRIPNVRVDYLGAILCVVGLGGLVFALIESPRLGLYDPLIMMTGFVGIVASIGFIWRQRVARDPLMPLSLFKTRNFRWGNVATVLIYGALSLNGLVIVVYLQEVAGLSATQSGLTMIPLTILMIALSPRVGKLAGRFGPRIFMTVGPILSGIGMLFMLTIQPQFNYFTQLLPGVLFFGVGLSVTVSPLTSAILGSIDPARSGIASAVNNAISRIAGLLTIALVGVIVGGDITLEGLQRSLIFCAVLLFAGGTISWLGIRKPAVYA
ncbi:MFS transporter [Lysinibacter sp. HNR]|uniref:MFS transporter n=1 Tax=Lysinibacter sp. HNR TaxID=3031408 RepID=UPI0024357676|nr:MFS transporter [Lysinibacter sp. HNR]WGD38346.1 MFS transporter [Lysinibacter sp. HNR]